MRNPGGRVAAALLALLTVLAPLPARPAPAQHNATAQLLENGSYRLALQQQIRSAQRRIICVFFLFKVGDSPDNLPRLVARDLVAAQRRGVDVTVVLESGRQVARDNEVVTRLLAKGGVRVVFAPRGVTTHAKAVAVDDRYVLLGSHNLTQAALAHNNELSVLLDSPQLAAQVRSYLERIQLR